MPIALTDLGGGLIAALVWVSIIAALLALLVWDARRRRVPSVILDVTGAVARVWVMLVIIGSIAGLVGLFVSPTTTITDLPVGIEWPTVLPCQSAGETTSTATSLYCARLPTATAEITGLSGGTKALIFLGGLLAYLVAAVPGVLVAALCRHASAGAPFARPASRWLLASSIVILVSGMLAEIILAIGRFFAAAEVLPGASSGGVATTASNFAMSLPIWPIGAALALAALAAVFRYGFDLQRQTAALQRDTEGLV